MLDALVRDYHRLQNDHKRAAPGSAVRRRIEERLLDARQRFDRVLAEWVPEPDLRTGWRQYLHYRAPPPPGPQAIRPVVFRGVSDAGAVVEIRGRAGEELAVEVDGSLVERVVGEKDFAAILAPATFRLDHTEFVETFSASPQALDALAHFLADGGSPPWTYASELLGDGLIDTHVGLTPRGRRALEQLPSDLAR